MLFKDSAKLKEYSELTSSVNFLSLKATLSHVEEIHIIPLLGKEQYKALNDAYRDAANEGALTQPLQDLLERVRKVIGPYLAYYYAPKGEVKLDDGGLRRLETATNKSAYQNQVTNFRDANLKEAEEQSEELLKFLEEKKADYALWVSSDSFKKYRSLFIKTGAEFDEYFTTASPYRNYWAMRFKMVDVEQLNIRRAIGEELFNALKTKDALATPAFTDKEKVLLYKLNKAIAAFTVSFSLPFLAVRIDANGITISSTGGSNDKTNNRLQATENQLSFIINKSAETGAEWLNDAIKYLTDNAADFNNWNEEEDTTPIDGTQPITEINTGLNGSFVF